MRINRPASDYKEFMKQVKVNAKDVLNDIVSESHLNIDENHKLAEHYYSCSKQADELKRNIMLLNLSYVGSIITGIVLGIVALCVGIDGEPDSLIISAVVSLIAILIPFLLIRSLIIPKIRSEKSHEEEANEETKHAREAVEQSIAPFWHLLSDRMTSEILTKTLDELEIDEFTGQKRVSLMEAYAPSALYKDTESSTLEIVSGQFFVNSFAIRKLLYHKMGTMVYTQTESFPVEKENSNGETITEMERCTATTTKPIPRYKNEYELIHTNSAGSNLNFHRMPQGEVTKWWNMVKAEHKQHKSIMHGNSGFTLMSNKNFEKQFSGFDRDNELQFREIWSPDSQANMLGLLNSKELGNGNFEYEKRNSLNIIRIPSNLTNNKFHCFWDMDTSVERYHSLDYKEIEKKFLDFNLEYARRFYQIFAPILCVTEFRKNLACLTSVEDTENNYSEAMAEVLANRINLLSDYSSRHTQPIITAKAVSSDEATDTFELTIFYYTEETDYESKTVRTSDGVRHTIDVPYVRYDKHYQTILMEMSLQKESTTIDDVTAVKQGLTAKILKDSAL